MGRLIVSMNVTLDGCCDHTQVIADEELHQYYTDLLDQSDAALYGRVTYQLMERSWPAVATSGTGPKADPDSYRRSRPRFDAGRPGRGR